MLIRATFHIEALRNQKGVGEWSVEPLQQLRDTGACSYLATYLTHGAAGSAAAVEGGAVCKSSYHTPQTQMTSVLARSYRSNLSALASDLPHRCVAGVARPPGGPHICSSACRRP